MILFSISRTVFPKIVYSDADRVPRGSLIYTLLVTLNETQINLLSGDYVTTISNSAKKRPPVLLVYAIILYSVCFVAFNTKHASQQQISLIITRDWRLAVQPCMQTDRNLLINIDILLSSYDQQQEEEKIVYI